MNSVNKNIWSLLDMFRKSKYFLDVVRQQFAMRICQILIRELLTNTVDDFGDSLHQILIENTMLEPRTIGPILSNNSTKKLRESLDSVFSEELDPETAFTSLFNLKNAGVYFTSYLLAIASFGEFVVYHDNLFVGFSEILPGLASRLLRVRDSGTYFAFQMMCDSLLESYRFTSLSEIHEFLWHGHDTDWTFR